MCRSENLLYFFKHGRQIFFRKTFRGRLPSHTETKERSVKKYILITPARNEEAYIEFSLKAVIEQTVRPVEWVIVSDRSTDGTDRIIKKYAAEHGFIKLVSLPPGQGRNFSSKVEAFKAGYRAISVKDYDFIGNLDADVSFAPDYQERLLEKFGSDEKLGIAGGVILELIRKKFRKQMTSQNSVAGAVQLFRRRCFEDIGGYVPIRYGGIDATAEIMARMHGWKVRAFDDLEVYHHRRVSGSSGVIRARFKAGMMHYKIGYHPLFQLASTFYRLSERPFMIGSLLTLSGYLWACLFSTERPVSDRQLSFLREEQLSRLRSMIGMKLLWK